MANDFSGMTWYIDTVMTGEAPQWKNCNVFVRSLNWSGMGTAGDQLVVKDRNGKTIYDVVAQAANENINLPNLGWQAGVVVTTLSSGNVQIAVGN